jgi:hypothetical protein
MHGEIDSTLQLRIRIKVAEFIDASPGIEILDLATKLEAISVGDLLLLCDALELDNVVYSVYRREQLPVDILTTEEDEIIAPLDIPTLLYWISLKQRDPTVLRITRKFYPCTRDHLSLALGLSNLL